MKLINKSDLEGIKDKIAKGASYSSVVATFYILSKLKSKIGFSGVVGLGLLTAPVISETTKVVIKNILDYYMSTENEIFSVDNDDEDDEDNICPSFDLPGEEEDDL